MGGGKPKGERKTPPRKGCCSKNHKLKEVAQTGEVWGKKAQWQTGKGRGAHVGGAPHHFKANNGGGQQWVEVQGEGRHTTCHEN